jgi:L-gulonate 3-dehydrogenase
MEKIAIVGSGLIGRSWAIVFARAGHPVSLFDAAPGVTTRALPLIRQAVTELRRFGLVTETEDAVMARIGECATLADAVGDADYVQESTAENLEIKRRVFRELDASAPSHCVLASSTSTIQASRFSEGLAGKQRCIVAHPMNPPHVAPVVEVSPAPWTSEDVVARTLALMQKAGQVAVTVKKEVEGFILNRLQAALLLEAWRLVGNGYASVEDVDKCVKEGLGLRWAFMGPFETIDLNAPGGIADYARRYGPAFHGMLGYSGSEGWNEALIGAVERDRRKILPLEGHGDRQRWRDSHLMALIAHKREER